MKDLMKAPLEGTVDTDPQVLADMPFRSLNAMVALVALTHDPATLEGELVDKGVEVKVYEDRIPLNDFLTQTLELRRERKKEIVANHNALEGEFEQGPPADMRKFFLPNGGIDVFALSAKAQRLAPKPAIEGELLPPPRQSPVRNIGEREISDLGLQIEIQRQLDAKTLEGEFIRARDPNAGSHKIEDFDPHSVNGLRHALQEIESAIDGEFIGKGERHISHIVEWTFCTEPGIAITRKGGGESCQANPKNKQISCEQPLTTKNLLIK